MAVIIYLISSIYFETIIKVKFFTDISFINSLQTFLFILFISSILGIITSVFNKKINKILLLCFTFISTVFYGIQICVNDIYKSFFSVNLFGAAGQVFEFKDEILTVIIDNLLYLILLFIPFIILVIFQKKIKIKPNTKRKNILYLIFILISFLSFNLALNIDKDKTHSSYNLFYNLNEVNLSVRKLGVCTSFYLDIFKYLIDFEEDLVLEFEDLPEYESDEQNEAIVYDYNVLDIDFNAMPESLDNLNNYFALSPGTMKNEYTSFFEGKNLIYIMAETFNEIAVDETRTPTLYKLVNEGFNFENFYSPTIYSTIGGEFQLLTGLYPASGFVTTFKSGENDFPFGLSTSFENIGYTTYAYHNNSYTFQNRNIYLSSLGFDNFLACNNGLEKLMDCSWLASDSDMFNVTFDDYSSDENFMAFYSTVSGHGDYYYSGEFTSKYLDLVDPSLSEGIASYLAAQIELDRALEILLGKLEDAGILDDTVIVLAGDHHPYYLDIDEINEASDYEKDAVVEVDHSNLIIYNSAIESVSVSKVASQVDVIPTVYNLFGIEYDSRLFTGNDILSTTSGLAIFSDRSWISDYGTYFASTGKFVLNSNYTSVSDNYVDNMNTIVSNKITMSSLILSTDYYSYIKN